MNAWRRIAAVFREAGAAALASPIASIATVVMVGGLCAAVLLTTGRTIGAEQAVLASIDSAGTRTIVVRAEPTAGLTSSVLDRLSNVSGIEWAAAFGPAADVTNSRIPDGDDVAARLAYGDQLTAIGIPRRAVLSGATAWGTAAALARLGLADGTGSVTTQGGVDFTVDGQVRLPDWLDSLGPTLIVPQASASVDPVSLLVIVARRPDLVAPLSAVVQSVLAADNPSKITMTTSIAFAELHAIVRGQLGTFGRGLVLLVLAVGGVLVAAILAALVALRRRDFGRRRALGASRRLIVGILLAQIVCLAAGGVLLGTGGATIALAVGREPLPGFAFTAAIAILAIAVSLAAALIPALFAARRDPIRELRLP